MGLSGRSLVMAVLVMWGTWSVAAAALFPQAVPPVSGVRAGAEAVGPVVREGMNEDMVALSRGLFMEEIDGMETPTPMTPTPEAEYLDMDGVVRTGDERMMEESPPPDTPTPEPEEMY